MKPELIADLKLKESTWDLIQKGLYRVANSPGGTAFWRRGKGNQMAGKTGTSQVVGATSVQQLYSKCEDKEYKFRHHGVFAAFAPYQNPRIAVAALVEHGCHGSSAAAPVVEAVISKYMEKNMPEFKKKYTKIEREQLIRYIRKRKAAREKAQEAEDE